MHQGYPRLLGDIGGTNARWAWIEQPRAPLQDITVRACADHASMYESAADYLAQSGHANPCWVAIGVATPVTGDQVRLTNQPWAFSIAELQRALGAQRCLVMNDFTALALSLPALQPGDLLAIGGGAPTAGAPLALLGPGTGLGVSGLLPSAESDWSPLSGEGGHVTLAAADDHEAALIAWLRRRFGHVSAERALSGQGLINLYEALCAVDGRPARALQPAELTRAAIDGSDAQCARTIHLFAGMLGGVAGDITLTLGARGGVYIGGGIVPRLGAAFDGARFRSRFEQKGRFASYLQSVPTWVITATTPALIGADRALDSRRVGS